MAKSNIFSVHAEIAAAERISDARGCMIYVARINSLGDDMLSRPCDYCYQYLIERGFKGVVYTTN